MLNCEYFVLEFSTRRLILIFFLRICPFCDWKCYGNPSQLDKHYWKACPILTRCPQCALVLEVAALNSHLTKECDAKISYINCERCTEAVHFDLHEFHLMEDYCRGLFEKLIFLRLCIKK